jgi:hypothetical protein
MRPLDEMGLSPDIQARAKLVWLFTAFFSIFGWIFGKYLLKIEEQDDSAWFQWQLRQAQVAGLVGALLWWVCGLGALACFVVGIMGFLAIRKGQDYAAPVIAEKLLSRGEGPRG